MTIQSYECPGCGNLDATLARELEFNLCPTCGALLPVTLEKISSFFKLIQLSSELDRASKLTLKGETVASIREALVVFETAVRSKSGLQAHTGPDLMAKAFSFEVDSKDGSVTRQPKIALNNLGSLSERNEQEGVKLMAMGLMQGVRNIYMHTAGDERLFLGLQILATVDLLLKRINRR